MNNRRFLLPALLGMAALGGLDFGSSAPIRRGGRSVSKYEPHQGEREKARRVRQMERNAAKRAA